MTNSQLSVVAALPDRSGSVHSISDDIRGGFDTFIIKEREADGRTMVTLAQFDDRYELVYDSTPIEGANPLVLDPRGSTALYDAVLPRQRGRCRAIRHIGGRAPRLSDGSRDDRRSREREPGMDEFCCAEADHGRRMNTAGTSCSCDRT